MDAAEFATEPSPVADVTASSAAVTLVEQTRRIGGGRPCLVVAHSMGGVVATSAAELAPELFAGLVYVTAFAPVAGLPAAAYATFPENAGELANRLIVADPAAVGAVRIDTSDPDRHGLIRETFYNDVDADTAAAATAMLSTDGPAGIPGETLAVTAPRYGAVRHAYVVCTRDNTIPVALQRRFVREIDAVSARPTAVTELESSHSPFLSRPAALAEVIASVELDSTR
jgi:pimeloyl-ACP methyl ester carboxylesterase